MMDHHLAAAIHEARVREATQKAEHWARMEQVTATAISWTERVSSAWTVVRGFFGIGSAATSPAVVLPDSNGAAVAPGVVEDAPAPPQPATHFVDA